METEQRSIWLQLERDNKRNGEISVQIRYVPDLQTQAPVKTAVEEHETEEVLL